MSTTISSLVKEISQIISNYESIPIVFPLHDIQNPFQVVVNNFKIQLNERTNTLDKLVELFLKLTNYDIVNLTEEELLNELISNSLIFHLNGIQSISDFKILILGTEIFQKEIIKHELALNGFEETVYDVKEAFYNPRNDGKGFI